MGVTAETAQAQFGSVVVGPWWPLAWQAIVMIVVSVVIIMGVQKGIEKITKTLMPILTALGLAFFKLSLAMGAMVTHGSYFTNDNNLVNTSAKVAVSDTMVSLLTGIAIFPAVFSFGMEPGAGPGLLFMTIPLVFSQMPLGNLLLIAFFVLTSESLR